MTTSKTVDLPPAGRRVEPLVGRPFFRVGSEVRFAEERKPYTIRAMSERFVICTRPIRHHGETTVLYSIIDTEEMMRGPNDLVLNCYDYAADDGCRESLAALIADEIQLSRRHSIPLVLRE